MRITQSTQPVQNAEVMALLFAFAQVALAFGIFWALRGHIA